MNLCMMSCMMPGAEPEQIVRTAVDCGMAAVDWACSRKWKSPVFLRRISEDAGLAVAAHTVLHFSFAEGHACALDDFKRSLEFAVTLGAPVVMLPPFPRKEQVSLADDRKVWTEFYAEVLPMTRKAGVALAVESTGVLNSPITTASEIRQVLEAVPGLKCTLDYGNMETAEPSLDAYEKLKEYVVQFHLKDWKISPCYFPGSSRKRCGRYFANAVIGEGDMDLKAFWSTVDEAGRQLYVDLETMDFDNGSSTFQVMKKTADLLRFW